MPNQIKEDTPLSQLVQSAPSEALCELILNLAEDSPKIRRRCFDYLNKNKAVSKKLKSRSEDEALMSIWEELLPDLKDMDNYGGAPYDVEERVWDLLEEIAELLRSKKVNEACRLRILDYILPYIKSGNSGLSDELDELAYAACYTDSELRYLAESLEAMGSDWQNHNARRIYRKIGDDEKYLELRLNDMELGADYLDLAEYYWESGKKDQSILTAKKGLKEARGRMDELRAFMAERAKESGDRNAWIQLQFDQTVENLSLKNFKNFEKICTKEEWNIYEPKIIKKMKNCNEAEQMKIYMNRKDYEKVINILTKSRFPSYDCETTTAVTIAEKLEDLYPEKVLKWYLSGLGSLSSSQSRQEYARKARVMVKIRHILIDILQDEDRWKKFAVKVKTDNLRRPAFQEEFARIVPEWNDLNKSGKKTGNQRTLKI